MTLKEMRESKGFVTQKLFSEKLKTNRENIARWEQGKRHPRPAMLVEISKALDVPEREIIEAITAAKTKHNPN